MLNADAKKRTDVYKRARSKMSLYSETILGIAGKKFQYEEIVCAEVTIVNLGTISENNKMLDISESTKEHIQEKESKKELNEEEKHQIAYRYELQAVKNNDKIAKRMLFHDIIHFTLSKAQNGYMRMKE